MSGAADPMTSAKAGSVPAQTTLLLVGCGRMGSAMLHGWLDGESVIEVAVVEPVLHAPLPFDPRVLGVADAGSLAGDFFPDVVVLAVKPQMMASVLPAYRRFVRPETVFLSIAAGWTLASFARHLGEEAVVVRAMPNTPAAIGRGMTVAVADPRVSEAQRRTCHGLLAAVGDVAWVDDEALMDAVTAVSGSGPAYVFLLAEAMAAAGAAAGLPPELAAQLARATVSGAGELLRRAEEVPPSRLRENVTSPGGTTAAALAVLMAQDGVQPLMNRAIAAATARSQELAT